MLIDAGADINAKSSDRGEVSRAVGVSRAVRGGMSRAVGVREGKQGHIALMMINWGK